VLNIPIATAKRCFKDLQLAGFVWLNNENYTYKVLPNNLPSSALAIYKDKQAQKNKGNERLGIDISRHSDLSASGLVSLLYNEHQFQNLNKTLTITQSEYIVVLAFNAYYKYASSLYRGVYDLKAHHFFMPNSEKLAAILGLTSRTIKSINARLKDYFGFNFLCPNTDAYDGLVSFDIWVFNSLEHTKKSYEDYTLNMMSDNEFGKSFIA